VSITAAKKQELIEEYRRNDQDSGSPQVQVAILTHRIKELTEHLKQHKHDYASQRGLLQLVSKRKRHLSYLMKVDRAGYQALIQKLGLRR
jgi:small subunit ribosomal protein S15